MHKHILQNAVTQFENGKLNECDKFTYLIPSVPLCHISLNDIHIANISRIVSLIKEAWKDKYMIIQ